MFLGARAQVRIRNLAEGCGTGFNSLSQTWDMWTYQTIENSNLSTSGPAEETMLATLRVQPSLTRRSFRVAGVGFFSGFHFSDASEASVAVHHRDFWCRGRTHWVEAGSRDIWRLRETERERPWVLLPKGVLKEVVRRQSRSFEEKPQ